MANQIFTHALQELMTSRLNYWGPNSFQQYLDDNNIPKKNTAQYISIDAIEKLSPEQREAGVMVLRLVVSKEKGCVVTRFVLLKSYLSDFFLTLSTDIEPKTFLPKVSVRDLFAY